MLCSHDDYERLAPRWCISSAALTAAMLACFAVGGWLLAPAMWNQSSDAVASVLPSQPVPRSVTQNIEDIRLGQRVVGTNPLEHETQPASDIRPEQWRAVRLSMHAYGVDYDLAFLRPLAWLTDQQATLGGTIDLSMPEMGLDGPATVVAIEPCPSIERDDGQHRPVVTGTMRHLAANVLDVQIDGERQPLGVTDTHPLWSVDREAFVVAGELQVGEQLQRADGTPAAITRITPRTGPPVQTYNLEVDGQHVYHVGKGGLLVHNACPSGLRTASLGLQELFANGTLSGRSIIGIRETLSRNGFTQQLTRNRQGFLFTNSLGEEVRVMRRNGGWDLRVRNAAGNYLDDAGNVAPPSATHGISVFSY